MRKAMTRQELLVAIANSRQWANEETDPRRKAQFLRMAQGLEGAPQLLHIGHAY
jgi:hypothetical protein